MRPRKTRIKTLLKLAKNHKDIALQQDDAPLRLQKVEAALTHNHNETALKIR